MVEEEIKNILRTAAISVGIANITDVSDDCMAAFDEWLAQGNHAGMDYMTRYREIRKNPTLLLDGAKSIICMAFSYRRDDARDPRLPRISAYAFLPDYHYWIKDAIRRSGIGEMLGEEGKDWRICVDSAPIMERYWAVKSGIGIRGDNGAIIIPGIGSDIFLAEIVTTLELNPDEPLEGNCGHCGACREACPTGALRDDGTIDCNHCLSYLTIEHRGEWTDPRHLAAMHGEAGRNTLFGCDRCVAACPHNPSGQIESCSNNASGRVAATGPEVLESIINLDASQMDKPLKGTCLQRAGKAGLLRNAHNCHKR